MKQRFKVGDKVVIVRKVNSHSNGWDNSWAPEMLQFVGNGIVYTITEITNHNCGYVFDYANDGAAYFRWPDAALEAAEIVVDHEIID